MADSGGSTVSVLSVGQTAICIFSYGRVWNAKCSNCGQVLFVFMLGYSVMLFLHSLILFIAFYNVETKPKKNFVTLYL